jgi:hypothetical protein
MAKHVILEAYTFTPSTRTVAITGKNIRREQLLLITNTTTNTVIYNFSDPDLKATSYTNAISTTTGLETTTVVLNYNTTAMSSTDKLSIMVEETYTEIVPSETMRDPVDKMRVSTPQSLIDTDFEYGTQPTKWESLQMLNNRPSAFYDSTTYNLISAMTSSTTTVSVTMQAFSGSITSAAIVSTITGISSTAGLYAGMTLTKQSGATATFGSGLVATILSVDSATQITVQTSAVMVAGAIVFTQSMPAVGQPIFVQGTYDTGYADGWWLCTASTAGTGVFTYSTIVAPTMVGGTLLDATKTYVYFGSFYTGAAIPAGTSAIVTDGTRATVTTTNGHGLRIGDSFYVVGSSTNTALNNTWVVERTLTSNTFTFLTSAAATTHTTPANACIYPRGQGYVVHRPFDGGVQFSDVAPYHGYQVIRQTRRQFRYQSGKAMQFSTGSIIKPALTVDNITSSGATVTVTCKYPHGLLPGGYIKVSGSSDNAYNGIFAVATVTSTLVFTYSSTALYTAVGNTTTLTLTTGTTPSTTPAPGFPLTVSPYAWYGSANRVGLFDGQNGFFFEYDGQNIYCVKRSSTQQISGSISVTASSATLTGTSTKFSQELKPGDYIVIRGMSYLVQAIASDTSMFIYPEYRGASNIANVIISKTIDTRYVQSSWNIDKMDGTGASQYNLDPTRMQMFYIDYTWYGAGAIRFGFKNTRGEVIYCHRIPNNNLNTEAYMRSGNLVARYETNSFAPITYLTSTLTSGVTASMAVADTSAFPSAGTLVLSQAANTGAVIEYITYTGKTSTTFTGLSRNYQGVTIPGAGSAAGGSATATTFTVTGVTAASAGGTAPIKVELYGPSQASTIGHWGSAVIMDGRYDDDKSLVFVGGMNRSQLISNVGQDITVPLISIRISPSIDNGLTGVLGSREVVNRMQLVMRSLSTITTGTNCTFLISLRLNGRVSGGQFASVGGSSLAQIAVHSTGTTITGGENVFGFYTASGVNTEDLNQVRDLGTSILGGGTVNTCPTTANNVYPDGPDIITVCATNVTAVTTNSILGRISWTEAQA